MNKLKSLIKTDLNITFGLSSIAYSFKSKKNRWQIILFSFAILSLIPSYIMMINVLGTLYDGFKQMGQQSYFLLMGFLGSQMMVLVFGLLYVMSKYYFSNDLSHLVPLPIKPSYILTSKFVTLMVSEYLTSLPIILPFIFIYGIKGSEGLFYWIYAFILALFLPVLPLVLSSLIIMIFMKYTNIKGKKDLLRTISAVIFIIIMIYVQVAIQQMAQKALLEGDNFFFNLARDSNLLVKKLGVAFPPSQWGAMALANNSKFIGLTNLLMFVIVGVIGFVIMILLSEKLFFDGLIGNIEVSASKGRGKKKDLERSSNVTKPYLAIAMKEIKMLFKTPIYLMNSVGGVVIVPVILVISVITGEQSMEPLMNVLYGNIHLVTLASIGLVAFLGMMNSVGTTTFSREGKNFWIQRTLPIRVEDQIFGRVLASLMIQLLGIVILIGSMFFIIKLDFLNILLIIILGLLGSIPMTQIGMIIDILRPMLTWTNPQQAMKQNLNVLIGMGVSVLYGGAIVLLIMKLLDKVDLSLIYGLITLILLVSTVGFYIVLRKLIIKQFQELE